MSDDNSQEQKNTQDIVVNIPKTINDYEADSNLVKALISVKRFGLEIEVMVPKVGAPLKMTERTIELLSEAWLFGCNDEEASTYAGIAPATLYNFQKDKPEFLEYKEHLKRNPVIKARMSLYKSLDDPQIAWKYLQRKTTDLAENDKPNVQLNVQLNQLVEQDRKRLDETS